MTETEDLCEGGGDTVKDTDQNTGTARLRYNGKAPEIKIIHPKVPPGLECLLRMDKVLIKRRNVLLDGETKSTKIFEICNEKGELLFGAKEDDEPQCFSRSCLGSIRPFDMIIYDSGGREIIHLTRPCTFPSYLAIYSPPGSLVGTIVQKRGLRPKFKVKNHIEDCECEIRGPIFTAPFRRRNIDYQVESTSLEYKRGKGKISKLWQGFWKRSCPDVYKFSVDFPSEAHPNIKATLIGAAFLFNCMYF